MMRVLLLLLVVAAPLLVCASPLPDKPLPNPEFGGFRPVHGARGSGPSSGYRSPPVRPSSPVHVEPDYSATGPTKTIYVNVPAVHPAPPLPPVAAGPPRKHYKIVFIRAPPPPPQTQHVLPPRTEQKTLIYVLHQRQDPQQQEVIKVPHVQHDPEVYFVEYDTPPSAQELQQLSSGNLKGYSVTAQRTGGHSDELLDVSASEEFSVALPVPGLRATGVAPPQPPAAAITRKSAAVGPGVSNLGVGLRVIDDDVFVPLGNTGLFQEVDDDLLPDSSHELLSIDLNSELFKRRVGPAAAAAAGSKGMHT